MLRGWLLRGCAAPSRRVSLASAPTRLISTCQGSSRSRLRQAQQQLPVQPQQRPVVTCLAGLEIGRRYSKPADFKPATSFDDLKLDSRLLEALNAANLDAPTDIQSLAIPAILSGGDYLLAAQTGSGKTLAYLLPLIHAVKAREGEPGMERRGKRPKVLVLAPTKELVEQITAVAKTLCHYAKFRVVPCSANYNENIQSRSLTAPLEVLVATPTRLTKVLEHGRVALGDVRWLVIDEADTMLEAGGGFAAEVRQLVSILRSKDPPAQTVLVTATMSKAVKQLVTAFLPDLIRIEAAGFHKPVATARHEFRLLSPGGDKMQLLLEVLQSDVAKGRKVVVFCNSMNSCRAVEHTVRERDMPTVCYHGDMPISARKEAMAQFAGNHAAGGESGATATVMVATDLAARGLDFPGTIDHVINFDMPGNAIDYLHRAGRTARAGAQGRVTSLLQSKRDRDMGKAIQYALDNGMGLDQVSVNSGAEAATPQQQTTERWMPPKREHRQKAPTPVKGQKQVVLWNPNHKFLHIRDGVPIVPFKELLNGKTGDERRKLLYEIAMDQKEWRRWIHAKAVEKSDKKRQKRVAKEQQENASRNYPPPPSTPQEKWQQKMARRRTKQWAAEQQQQGGGGDGGGRGGGRGAGGSGRGRQQSGRKQLFGRK